MDANTVMRAICYFFSAIEILATALSYINRPGLEGAVDRRGHVAMMFCWLFAAELWFS